MCCEATSQHYRILVHSVSLPGPSADPVDVLYRLCDCDRAFPELFVLMVPRMLYIYMTLES